MRAPRTPLGKLNALKSKIACIIKEGGAEKCLAKSDGSGAWHCNGTYSNVYVSFLFVPVGRWWAVCRVCWALVTGWRRMAANGRQFIFSFFYIV